MKRMLIIASAVALLASPLVAQAQQKDPPPKARVEAAKKAPKTNGPNDVYCGGQYVGSDPDANVRDQLKRDFGHQCE